MDAPDFPESPLDDLAAAEPANLTPTQRSLLDLVDRLRKVHESDESDPIPLSTGIHKIFQDLCPDPEILFEHLNRLINARYVMSFIVVEGNRETEESDVRAYVVAEVPIIHQMTRFYGDRLEQLYELEMYRRKDADGIIKELLAHAGAYSATPLGRVMNTVVMLRQLEKTLVESYFEFSESKKLQELQSLATEDLTETFGGSYTGEDDDADQAGQEADASPTHPEVQAVLSAGPRPERNPEARRAVESTEYGRLEEMNLSGDWGKSVGVFGVQFLLRIHFRKYEFKVVSGLVKSRGIAREVDLVYVRTTLEKMLENLERDPGLVPHVGEMGDLIRLVERRLKDLEYARALS